MKKRLLMFEQALQKGEFYKAHEILEEIWFPKRRSAEAVYLVIKGFINASVSFELIKRGKKPQAQKVWKNFQKYAPLIEECENREELMHTKKTIEVVHERLSRKEQTYLSKR